ncbi:hypothetical protein CTAYLR_003773 [Chrysophaeum taylorii]|uniref:Transmembrane protein 230 n=1 Tax=Chrysophaeum taylorii TaxID=2483200 RepID=A0AAD7UDR4_9STRA|nr:hypothetical protein CTAYLR_003773 [Chrysophaeum taylorii]
MEDPGYELRWLRRFQRARYPPPPKTAIAAISLLVLGSVLFVTSLADHWYKPKRSQRFPLFVLSLLTLPPGAFASFVLFAAFRRWPGYSYTQVPSWDD